MGICMLSELEFEFSFFQAEKITEYVVVLKRRVMYTMHVYYVICVKLPFRETNSVIQYQLLHTFVTVFIVNTAQGAT